MAIKYFAHAVKGETTATKTYGGKAGDQTGGEVCIRSMYFSNWQYVLHIVDSTLRQVFGNNMLDICRNNKIGYDQSGRNTLLAEAEKVGFNFSRVVNPCECDCSSAVSTALLGAIYKVKGKDAYAKAKSILAPGGKCMSTRTLRNACKKLGGITVYSSATYTKSTSHTVYGDIYLRENVHVGVYVENAVSRTSSTGYRVGANYTLRANMNVRTGPGTEYPCKKRSQLTADGKKHAKAGVTAVLKKGTVVTCKQVYKDGPDTWIQIPSGFVCAKQGTTVYIA